MMRERSLITVSATIIGTVPRPKAYISIMELSTVGAITVADNAIYTNPQGNRPLSIPVINKLNTEGCPMNAPSLFCTKPVHGSLMVLFMVIFHTRYHAQAVLFEGLATIAWIVTQMIVVQDIVLLQIIYLSVGAILVLCSLSFHPRS